MNALTRPAVVEFVDIASRGVDLEISEYVVPEGSVLAGMTLGAADVRRKSGALVVAIKPAEGETLTNPGPDTLIAARDTLILIGAEGVSSRLGRLEMPD